MFGGKFPNLTAAQIVAVVGALIGAIVAFGVDLSADQQQSILTLVTVLSSALVVSDAGLRAARNAREAKIEAAKQSGVTSVS